MAFKSLEHKIRNGSCPSVLSAESGEEVNNLPLGFGDKDWIELFLDWKREESGSDFMRFIHSFLHDEKGNTDLLQPQSIIICMLMTIAFLLVCFVVTLVFYVLCMIVQNVIMSLCGGRSSNSKCVAKSKSICQKPIRCVKNKTPENKKAGPCAKNQKPDCNKTVPCAKNQKPDCNKAEPCAKNPKPDCNKAEPCAKNRKPDCNKAEPCVKTPDCKKPVPCAVNQKPDCKKPEHNAKNQKPDCNKLDPSVLKSQKSNSEKSKAEKQKSEITNNCNPSNKPIQDPKCCKTEKKSQETQTDRLNCKHKSATPKSDKQEKSLVTLFINKQKID
ncbi:salivary glue protein Sgs-4-like [Teleopsis dalmanni]|uniref:salivary glue protein Sgs-4-like n=1 Tax=Teleopsis dalmanni TaxID=139649 RepID=UPI0018CFDAEA|nr:salivary glue protein Sgs-4-like [Teleopsis dalmanni]